MHLRGHAQGKGHSWHHGCRRRGSCSWTRFIHRLTHCPGCAARSMAHVDAKGDTTAHLARYRDLLQQRAPRPLSARSGCAFAYSTDMRVYAHMNLPLLFIFFWPGCNLHSLFAFPALHRTTPHARTHARTRVPTCRRTLHQKSDRSTRLPYRCLWWTPSSRRSSFQSSFGACAMQASSASRKPCHRHWFKLWCNRHLLLMPIHSGGSVPFHTPSVSCCVIFACVLLPARAAPSACRTSRLW